MEKQRLTSASRSSLPVASVIPEQDIFERAVALLKEGIAVKVKMSELEERASEIRDELGAIAEAFDLKGFRHGMGGFEYHGYTTRKSLSKEMLLSHGVSADVIAQSYKDSEPFMSAKFIVFDLE